jgi:hypothetical protein
MVGWYACASWEIADFSVFAGFADCIYQSAPLVFKSQMPI